MTDERKNKGLWGWILIALFVAALLMGVLYYIGWFNSKTHVDTPEGDNVTQTYQQEGAGADTPGVESWQNADHESLGEIITGDTVVVNM